MAAAKQLITIPPGFRLKTVAIDGAAQSVLVPKTHRKSNGMTKTRRERISASLRKIKIPVLTIAANTPAAIGVLNEANRIATLGYRPDRGIKLASSALSPYTGIVLEPLNLQGAFKVKWDWRELMKGTIPNAIVWGINKIGIFRSVNQKLARARLPIRLN